MKTLRSETIRLAAENPELRPLLLPLLRTAGVDQETWEEIRDAATSIASSRWRLRGGQEERYNRDGFTLLVTAGKRAEDPKEAERQADGIVKFMTDGLSRWSSRIQEVTAGYDRTSDWIIRVNLR